jgi:hypothetical protein
MFVKKTISLKRFNMKTLLFWLKLNAKQVARKDETQIFLVILTGMSFIIGLIYLLKFWFS